MRDQRDPTLIGDMILRLVKAGMSAQEASDLACGVPSLPRPVAPSEPSGNGAVSLPPPSENGAPAPPEKAA